MSKAATIREYIHSEPPQVRKALKQMHALVKKAAPKAGEKLAWGMPTLTLEGNLVHFAAFKNHQSLFPGTEAVTHFQPQLKKYTTTKAAIHFPYDKPLPAALIQRVVKFCVKQNLMRAKARMLKRKKSRRALKK